MEPDFLASRPDLSLLSILGYALFAFAVGLLLTPWFISFLRRNRLGKQLRVETVDGREATIFRQYHQKKFGTPTMGGLLIWGSIVLTVFFSRLLSLSGLVHSSLLQRGQVYVPLLMLVAFGVLGALDDYLNIVGTDEERMRSFLPQLKRMVGTALLAICVGAFIFFYHATGDAQAAVERIITNFGIVGLGVLVLVAVIGLLLIFARSAKFDTFFANVMLKQGAKRGLSVLPKISSLLAISIAGALWFFFALGYDSVYVPFFGPVTIGWWYIPLFVFVIVGTANAVNVTDGLDGLAGGLLVIAFGSFGCLAYLFGLYVLAGFCAVCAGAIVAFLWHNVPPALFYMGDTGALALGGTLGVIALMTDQVFVLPLVGFVFVIEMLSVIIQLTSKKLRGGKKVFKAAPIHHHFEALEWGESKVTMRMWIVGAFMAFFGLIVGIFG